MPPKLTNAYATVFMGFSRSLLSTYIVVYPFIPKIECISDGHKMNTRALILLHTILTLQLM